MTATHLELDCEASHVPRMAACVGIVGVGVALWQWDATGDPALLLWAAAGAALVAVAPLPWLMRLRAVVSDTGVRFTPTLFHGRHAFTWAEVRGWQWRRGTTSFGEGGDAEWRLLVLVRADGTEKLIPEPYCDARLGDELARRVGPESTTW